MAKVNADVEMKVRQASAIAAMAAFENRFKQMMANTGRSIGSQGTEAKKVTNEFASWSTGIGKAVVAAGALAGTFGTLRSIVQIIKMEIDAVVQAAEKARGQQLTFNEAMADVHFTLPPSSTISTNAIRQRILDSNAPDKTAVANSVRGAISAGLTEDVEDRLDTAIRIAEMRPDLVKSKPEQLQALVESVMVGRRAYGGTIEEQTATMLTAASAARITDIGKFSENIGGLLPILKQFGFNEKEALAFGSALSIGMNDPDGATTRTNVYEFVSQLLEEYRGRGDMDTKGMAMLTRLRDPDDPTAKAIRNKLGGFLQADLTPEEAEDLRALEEGKPMIEGRARGKVALIQLLEAWKGPKGDEHMQTLIDTAMREILTGPEAATFMQKRQQEIRGADWYQVQLAEYNRLGFEQRRLADKDLGAVGVANKSVEDLHVLSGGTAFEGRMEKFLQNWRLTGDSVDIERATNEMFAQSLVRQRAILGKYGYGLQGGDLRSLGFGERDTVQSGFFRRTETPISDVLAMMDERDRKIYEDLSRQTETLGLILKTLQTGIPVEEKNKPRQAPRPVGAAP